MFCNVSKKANKKKQKKKLTFSKGCCFLLGNRRNMIFSLLWEALVEFVEKVIWIILSKKAKISMLKGAKNWKACEKYTGSQRVGGNYKML